MKRDNFTTGIETLEKAFQGYRFNYEFLWENLKQLNDGEFKEAIDFVVKKVKYLNENTNLVAMIIENSKKSPYANLPNQKF